MHTIPMKADTVQAEALRIRRIVTQLRMTQQQIAEGTGVSQSQVSRMLGGHAVRRSRAFDRVCSYVTLRATSVTAADVRRCPVLIDALALVWDGSQAHADALATVICSLGAFPSLVASREPRKDSP